MPSMFMPEVEHMLRTGCTLEEIEQWIDHQPIPDEERSQLWLFAFLELTTAVPVTA